MAWDKNISARVPEELYNRLERVRKALGVTRQDLINECLENTLSFYEKETPKPSKIEDKADAVPAAKPDPKPAPVENEDGSYIDEFFGG